MILTYKDIVGSPVMLFDEGNMVAIVKDVIINPNNGKLEALWVKALTDEVIGDGILRTQDIVEWKNNLYIKDAHVISEPGDVLAIDEILDQNILFIGNNVQNEIGESLGSVYGAEFDTKSLYLKAIYTAQAILFFKFNKRIFSYDSIINVTEDLIVVKDKQTKAETEEASDLEPELI